MTDLKATLAGVLENHKDDLARAAYADALEEAGLSQRAQIIRIMLNGFDNAQSRGELYSLLRQDQTILPTNGTNFDFHWRKPVQEDTGLTAYEVVASSRGDSKKGIRIYTIRKGFLEKVEDTAANLLDFVVPLVQCNPVSHVIVSDLKPEMVRQRGSWSGSPIIQWRLVPTRSSYFLGGSVYHKVWPFLVGHDRKNLSEVLFNDIHAARCRAGEAYLAFMKECRLAES